MINAILSQSEQTLTPKIIIGCMCYIVVENVSFDYEQRHMNICVVLMSVMYSSTTNKDTWIYVLHCSL